MVSVPTLTFRGGTLKGFRRRFVYMHPLIPSGSTVVSTEVETCGIFHKGRERERERGKEGYIKNSR